MGKILVNYGSWPFWVSVDSAQETLCPVCEQLIFWGVTDTGAECYIEKDIETPHGLACPELRKLQEKCFHGQRTAWTNTEYGLSRYSILLKLFPWLYSKSKKPIKKQKAQVRA